MSTSSSTSNPKSRERIGTPLLSPPTPSSSTTTSTSTTEKQQRERSSAPSPSPFNSPVPNSSIDSGGRVLGKGRIDAVGGGGSNNSPFKRFSDSSNNNEKNDNNLTSTTGGGGGREIRIQIISDPSISSAFKQDEDKELWELFLK